jgi:UDP-N-acetylmuramate: L-alanyl-gamma-D-glutamyl-meso-diaminopimelate ligase
MLRWQQLGEHNQMNALAAIAAAAHVGVSPQQAIEALSDFAGVKRRMERRGTVQGVTVYDDFAHHPTAIQTTLEGLRHQVGRARILAVLEPRSNTMKLGTMKAALPESVQAADRVFVYGKDLGWSAREVFQPLGDRVVCADALEQLIEAIAHEARDGDHVLVMSNGGFGGIHTKLLERLGKQTR